MLAKFGLAFYFRATMIRILIALMLLSTTATAQAEVGVHGMYLGKTYNVALKALYNSGNMQFGAWGQHVGSVGDRYEFAYRSAGLMVHFMRMDEDDHLGFYNSIGLGAAHTTNAGYGALLFGKFGARVRIVKGLFICAEAGVQARTVPWDEGTIKPLFEIPVSFGINYRFSRRDNNVEVVEGAN